MTTPPTFDDILAAQKRLAGHAVRTPLLWSPVLSERLGARVYLKPECLQRTGSFKFRGAWNAVRGLGAEPKGLVAVSSGNHAQGVAEAARLTGIPSVIVMPSDAPRPKIRRTERSGARIVLYDRAREDRDAVVARVADEEKGFAFVHPFNDALVIAGQGTVGLEIAEDCTTLGIAPDAVLVPCSGGGLCAGVALAVTERFPNAQVHAAEPRDFDDMRRSLAAGAPQRNPKLSGSICDALLAPEPGAIGWEINRRRLAGGVAAGDAEALHAVGFAFDELRLVVEPGGAVGLAALLSAQVEAAGRTIVVVLSGGNIGDEMLAEGVAAYRRAEASRVSIAG
jgi:threonine dehydratase